MGWTYYRATHYKDGQVDRKAECNAYFEEGLNKGHFKVLKSTMYGSVYYAAVQKRTEYVGNDAKGNPMYQYLKNGPIFGAILLTHVNHKEHDNFGYKDMDETCSVYYYDCPESILKLLSDTDNAYAVEWRRKCREKTEHQKRLKAMPIGTVIEFIYDGEKKRLIKRGPAYQFCRTKKSFWFAAEHTIFKESLIPMGFTVVNSVIDK